MIRPSGDRVKTDARDAAHLARLLRLGEVTAVAVPEVEVEAVRDLVRAREDARADLMRVRHRLSKLLLRQGRVYSGGHASNGAHETWLRRQRFADSHTRATFDHHFDAVLSVGSAFAFLGMLPLLIVFFVWLISALVAALIADSRDRSGVGWFLATFFFLGPLGVGFALIAPHGQMDPQLTTPPEKRKLAEGSQRFNCPRCGADNDIPNADTTYDCWRCGEHRKVKPKVTATV